MKYISWSQIGRLKISKSAIFYKTIHKSSMLLLLRSHFSHPTLCDPIDGTLPSSPIPGILQARTMEWVAISFSNAWKWSRSIVSNLQQPHGLQPSRLLHPWDFPGRSIGVGCHCLLQNMLALHYFFLTPFLISYDNGIGLCAYVKMRTTVPCVSWVIVPIPWVIVLSGSVVSDSLLYFGL